MNNVFISFHFKDLGELVEELAIGINKDIVLEQQRLKAFHLNENRSYPGAPLENSLEKVASSRYMLLLIGNSLGSKPEGHDKTYIQKELEEAQNKQIPILVFLINYNEDKASDDVKNLIKTLDSTTTYSIKNGTNKEIVSSILDDFRNSVFQKNEESTKDYSLKSEIFTVSSITISKYIQLRKTYESLQDDEDTFFHLFPQTAHILKDIYVNFQSDMPATLSHLLKQLDKIFRIGSPEEIGSRLSEDITDQKILALKSIEAGNIVDCVEHLKKSHAMFPSDFYTCFWLARAYLYNENSPKKDVEFAYDALERIKESINEKEEPFLFAIYHTMRAVALMRLDKGYNTVNSEFNKAFRYSGLKESYSFLCQFHFKYIIGIVSSPEVDTIELKNKLIINLQKLLSIDLWYYSSTCSKLISIEYSKNSNTKDTTKLSSLTETQKINACHSFRDIMREIDTREAIKSDVFSESAKKMLDDFKAYIDFDKEKTEKKEKEEKKVIVEKHTPSQKLVALDEDKDENNTEEEEKKKKKSNNGIDDEENYAFLTNYAFNTYSAEKISKILLQSLYYFFMLKLSVNKIVQSYDEHINNKEQLDKWNKSHTEKLKNFSTLNANKFVLNMNIFLLLVTTALFMFSAYCLHTGSFIPPASYENILLYKEQSYSLFDYTLKIYTLAEIVLYSVLSLSVLFLIKMLIDKKRMVFEINFIKTLMNVNNLKLISLYNKYEELNPKDTSEIYYSLPMQSNSGKVGRVNINKMKKEGKFLVEKLSNIIEASNKKIKKDIVQWGEHQLDFEEHFLSIYDRQFSISLNSILDFPLLPSKFFSSYHIYNFIVQTNKDAEITYPNYMLFSFNNANNRLVSKEETKLLNNFTLEVSIKGKEKIRGLDVWLESRNLKSFLEICLIELEEDNALLAEKKKGS